MVSFTCGVGVRASVLMLAFCVAYCQIEVPSPIVNTNYGDVQGGRRIDRYGRTYDAFIGIPFGQPPVDELRWTKPTPPDSWDGVLQTTDFRAHCLQFINGFYGIAGLSTNHSEDCLYLNVYVPRGVDAQPEARPVMVFYYGGGFIFGTQEMYPPYHLANHGDVIVVNFDYRVSSIGFLSTGDDVVPGNYGLWDGHAVLEWIQQNIAAFGGDPDRVTIFGQSAGGALVSATSISPATQGLFQGAIAMSGGITGFLGTTPGSHTYLMTQFLGDIFECNSVDNQVIIDCLKAVDGEDIVFWGNVGSLPERNVTIPLRPTIDNDFIVGDPKLSYESGASANVHFISGNCKDDAAGTVVGNFFGLPINRTDGMGGKAETLEETIDSLRGLIFVASNKDELVNMIIEKYPAVVSDDRQTRTLALSEIETDLQYGSPSHQEADYHALASGIGSTYRYIFSHDQSFLFYPDWINGSHTDDMYSVFGEPYLEFARILYFLFGDFEPLDLQTSDNIMTYFTNFAYTFNPNDGPNPTPDEWPEYNPLTREYQVISPEPFSATLDNQDKLDKLNFWTNEFYQAAEYPDFSKKGEQEERIRFFFNEQELQTIVDRMKIQVFEAAPFLDEEQMLEISDVMDSFLERRRMIVESRKN